MRSPLEQFKVVPYIRLYNNYYDLTISNFSLFLFLSILIIFFILYNNNNRILSRPYIRVSNKKERISEIIYIKITEMVNDMLGITKYIPLLYSLFILVLINNLIGLVPYSFTVTSHIIYTLGMSLPIIIGITLIGINKHGWRFIKVFIPSGLDKGNIKFIIPLIFIIEVISYLSRIISLSVRLTANMISGHLLLHIITNFGIHLSLFLFFVPILLLFPRSIDRLIPIYILELAVAIIQSYVFTVLIISYLKDVEYLH